jgi:hypothetical protein
MLLRRDMLDASASAAAIDSMVGVAARQLFMKKAEARARTDVANPEADARARLRSTGAAAARARAIHHAAHNKQPNSTRSTSPTTFSRVRRLSVLDRLSAPDDSGFGPAGVNVHDALQPGHSSTAGAPKSKRFTIDAPWLELEGGGATTYLDQAERRYGRKEQWRHLSSAQQAGATTEGASEDTKRHLLSVLWLFLGDITKLQRQARRHLKSESTRTRIYGQRLQKAELAALEAQVSAELTTAGRGDHGGTRHPSVLDLPGTYRRQEWTVTGFVDAHGGPLNPEREPILADAALDSFLNYAYGGATRKGRVDGSSVDVQGANSSEASQGTASDVSSGRVTAADLRAHARRIAAAGLEEYEELPFLRARAKADPGSLDDALVGWAEQLSDVPVSAPLHDPMAASVAAQQQQREQEHEDAAEADAGSDEADLFTDLSRASRSTPSGGSQAARSDGSLESLLDPQRAADGDEDAEGGGIFGDLGLPARTHNKPQQISPEAIDELTTGGAGANVLLQRSLRRRVGETRVAYDTDGVYFRRIPAGATGAAAAPRMVKGAVAAALQVARGDAAASARADVVKVDWATVRAAMGKAGPAVSREERMAARERLIRLCRGEDPSTLL